MLVRMQGACFQDDPFLPLSRGLSECVHVKSGGHRPGAVQRHLPTAASTSVADTLPRSSGDLSHVAAVWTAYGTLPCVHGGAASGAPCAAVRASLAQCACPTNMVRAPTSLFRKPLFHLSQMLPPSPPEQPFNSSKKVLPKPRSALPHLELQSRAPRQSLGLSNGIPRLCPCLTWPQPRNSSLGLFSCEWLRGDRDWSVLCLQVSAAAAAFVLHSWCGHGGGLWAHLSRALPRASL